MSFTVPRPFVFYLPSPMPLWVWNGGEEAEIHFPVERQKDFGKLRCPPFRNRIIPILLL
jgi:hypothetical protein